MKNFKIRAFTLAEILITLGIIGVVAALTMHALIKTYQKNVTVNKLKETYSILSQAVKLSEIDNQTCDMWDYHDVRRNSDAALEWFNKYLKPYLKYSKIEKNGEFLYVYLSNGVIISLWYNGVNHFHVFVLLNGLNKTVEGKDRFTYFLGDNSSESYFKNKNSFIPYNYNQNFYSEVTRHMLLNDAVYGCNLTSTHTEPRRYCSYLIMFDG